MSQNDPYDPPQPSGWAVGGITFATTMMMLIGSFQIVAGLVAIFDDDFFVVAQNYTFDLDPSAWGWIHLILGVLLLVTGFGLLSQKLWAGIVALGLAAVTALENFFFIPYYPFWSLLVIALCIWVIWSLTRPQAVHL